MTIDTSLITWGAAITSSAVGLQRGSSIYRATLGLIGTPDADIPSTVKAAFSGSIAFWGVGVAALLTLFGIINSSELLLTKKDPGTIIAVLQAAAACKGVILGLILGAVAGGVGTWLYDKYLDH